MCGQRALTGNNMCKNTNKRVKIDVMSGVEEKTLEDLVKMEAMSGSE